MGRPARREREGRERVLLRVESRWEVRVVAGGIGMAIQETRRVGDVRNSCVRGWWAAPALFCTFAVQ